MDDVVLADFDPTAMARSVGIVANEHAQLLILPRFIATFGIVGGLRNVTDVAMFPRVDCADGASYSHDALIRPVETLAISL
ncbi:hypothetical protein NA29_18010 [Pandoraea sputorum]|nr:hypothetical protein NA29_18010 [Pandoraea sputorum]